jgi:hypothetical protein
VASPSDFDINGVHVQVSGSTAVYTASRNVKYSTAIERVNLYVGLPARIYGKLNRRFHTVAATEVVLPQSEPQTVSEVGVIDAVLPLVAGAPGEHLIRASGYRVLLSAKTSATFTPPLVNASSVRENLWISFRGTRRPDGVVVADEARFSENMITAGEEHLRSKTEYDPAAVSPDTKQGGLSKAVLGLDPKRIPPYQDSAMQARISAIGAKLVPQYQRALPGTDASKIDFRFQLVDQKKWHDAMALPNGIILVPHQVVERVQNDSQLAAVLADSIAAVLEKQSLRLQPAKRKMTAAQMAGAAGGFFVPGLGLAATAANSGVSSVLERRLQEERGRVSLFLLDDAGYDVFQAPLAWWRLATSKDLSGTEMPDHVAYLFKALGETWQTKR